MQKKLDPKPEEEKKNEEMEIEGFEDLPKLFISPIEKFMDEFTGNLVTWQKTDLKRQMVNTSYSVFPSQKMSKL